MLVEHVSLTTDFASEAFKHTVFCMDLTGSPLMVLGFEPKCETHSKYISTHTTAICLHEHLANKTSPFTLNQWGERECMLLSVAASNRVATC